MFEDPLARAVFANTRVPRRINAEKSDEAYQSIGESPPKVSNCISEETAPCLNSKYQQLQQCRQRQPQQAAQEPSQKTKKHGSDNKDNKDAFSRRDHHQQSKLTAAETAISDPTRNLNLQSN